MEEKWNWQEEFDKEFPSPDGRDFIGMERISSIKSFIENLLEQERKRLVSEIEKVDMPNAFSDRNLKFSDGVKNTVEKVLSIINK